MNFLKSLFKFFSTNPNLNKEAIIPQGHDLDAQTYLPGALIRAFERKVGRKIAQNEYNDIIMPMLDKLKKEPDNNNRFKSNL